MLMVLARTTIDELQRLAASQGGLFSIAQARLCGINDDTVRRWCEQGWVRVVRRGVYVFSGTPPSRWHVSVAAALAAGEGAVLSHRTAGAIHEFPGILPGPLPEITLPSGSRCRLAGVQVHHVGPVPPGERIERRGVQVTSRVRTLVDLAPVIHPELLGSVIDEGTVRRWWTIDEIDTCLNSQLHRRVGARSLRRLIVVRSGQPQADSRLEQRVFSHLEPLKPFEVHYQVVIGHALVVLDAAWPWWRVAAEVDGRSYRSGSRTAHDRESRKLNLLTSTQWAVAHLTSTMTADECVGEVLSVMPAGAFEEVRLRYGVWRPR